MLSCERMGRATIRLQLCWTTQNLAIFTIIETMAEKRDPVSTSIIRRILMYGAYLQREGGRILKPLGVSQQEYAVLSSIARAKEPPHQTRIVADLLVERSNLSKIVKRLKRKGLIELRPTANDRRSHFLHLSRAGRAMFLRAEVLLGRSNKQRLGAFTAAEAAKFYSFLLRLPSNPGRSR